MILHRIECPNGRHSLPSGGWLLVRDGLPVTIGAAHGPGHPDRVAARKRARLEASELVGLNLYTGMWTLGAHDDEGPIQERVWYEPESFDPANPYFRMVG